MIILTYIRVWHTLLQELTQGFTLLPFGDVIIFNIWHSWLPWKGSGEGCSALEIKQRVLVRTVTRPQNNYKKYRETSSLRCPEKEKWHRSWWAINEHIQWSFIPTLSNSIFCYFLMKFPFHSFCITEFFSSFNFKFSFNLLWEASLIILIKIVHYGRNCNLLLIIFSLLHLWQRELFCLAAYILGQLKCYISHLSLYQVWPYD